MSEPEVAPAALLAQAAALTRSGDAAGAFALLDAAVAARPGHRGLRLEQAAALRTLGRLEEAAEAYRALLAAEPGFAPALIGLGLCARAKGDQEAARHHFAAAAEADPASPWAALEHGHALRDLGRIAEAEAAYGESLRRKPGLVPALLALGHCARRRGARAAAREHFAEAARADPGNLAAPLELATECRALGDTAAAREALQALLARHPAHLPALLALGQAAREAGERIAAREAFEAAALAHPRDPRPRLEAAQEALALGDAAAAEALLQAAAALDPADPAPLAAVSEQARLAGRLETALMLAEQALGTGRPSLPAQLARAEALFDLGRAAAAVSGLADAAATLAPGQRAVLLARRASLLLRAGDPATARAAAAEAQAADPQGFAPWYARAQAEARLAEDPATLAACFDAAPAPRNAVERALCLLCRAEATELRERPAEAEALFTEAVAANPALLQAHQALARLALRRLDAAALRHHLAEALRWEGGAQGRPRNLSQSLMGQVLDEITLDAPLLARVAALGAGPAAERRSGLAALVREAPDALAPALALLEAMRAASTPGVAEPAGIPRAVAQYWHDGAPPADVAALMEGWRAAHPDHRLHRFDDRSAAEFLATRIGPAALLAFRRAVEPAMRADLLRLAWLNAEGGIWADADDRCLAPPATLAPPGTRLLAFRDEHGAVGNSVLAAVPGHPVIGRALALGVAALARGDADIAWLATGPGLLTRAMAQVVAEQGGEPVMPPGTLVLDRLALLRVVSPRLALSYKAVRRGGAPPRG